MPYLINELIFYRFSKKSLFAHSKFPRPPSWIAHNALWALMTLCNCSLQSLPYAFEIIWFTNELQILPALLKNIGPQTTILNNKDTFLWFKLSKNQMAFIYKRAEQINSSVWLIKFISLNYTLKTKHKAFYNRNTELRWPFLHHSVPTRIPVLGNTLIPFHSAVQNKRSKDVFESEM